VSPLTDRPYMGIRDSELLAGIEHAKRELAALKAEAFKRKLDTRTKAKATKEKAARKALRDSAPAAIEKRAAKLGATVYWQGDTAFTLDAPDGQVWAGEGLHGLVCHWYGLDDRAEALEDLWERTSRGLEECAVIGTCDVCMADKKI